MNYDCPEWVEALLWEIDRQMARVHWNNFQVEMSSPFQNTGSRFETPTFKVDAYSWDDDADEEPNFTYKDIRISWYKHLGRCTTINIDPKSDGFKEKMIEMFNDCIAELDSADKGF